jgi:predicted ATPase
VAHLGKGLDLLSGIPDRGARWEQELDLLITFGHALVATKGFAAAEPGEAYARGRQLCEQVKRPAQLGEVLVGQFVFRLVRGDLGLAELHAEEISQLGEVRNDPMWKCFGLDRSGTACFWLGKFIDARTCFEKYLSLWDLMYRASWPAPEDLYVVRLVNLSRTLLCLGYVDQARLRRNEALAEARRLLPHTLAFELCHAWPGDWAIEGVKSAETTLRSAEEVLAISDEQGFSYLFWFGNIMRGWCLGAMGQPAEAIPLILQGLDNVRATGAGLIIPFFLMTLAEVYGMAAQADEELKRLAEAANIVEATQERWVEAEMHRLRGTLLLSMHERVAAEDSFRLALTVAQQQSAKFWELRAATSLAGLWRDQGKRAEAGDLLAPIYGWFTEGFDTPILQDAKTLLDQLA